MTSDKDQQKKTRPSQNAATAAGRMIDRETIEELIALAREHDLEEVEVQEKDWRIRIKRGASSAQSPALHSQSHSVVHPAPALPRVTPTTPAQPPFSAAEAQVTPEADPDVHIIRSPMVGTFYRASGPTAKPFAEIGDRVKPGTVLCIIEAMKLMNNIDSDVDGEVVRIYAENTQPVEYNQPLFGIRPI